MGKLEGLKIVGKIELPSPKSGKHTPDKCDSCGKSTRWPIYTHDYGYVCDNCLFDIDNQFDYTEIDNEDPFQYNCPRLPNFMR